ncbi:MAG: Fic family protein [Alphaproteobacteria bacterium]
MWIYENKNWPNFTWDSDLLAIKLAEVRHKQGRLIGKMESLGFELRQEASLNILTNDVVNTSAIEGENLNSEEVRSSIARQLGMDIPDLKDSGRDVDGIVEIMIDATQGFQKPLTKERLYDWHAALFPTGRSGMHKITVAGWRTDISGPMQVISGPVGRETVHYQAPKAADVDREMHKFISWFESSISIDPVLKAGIGHLWFVTIHPFDDGNGRIGRAIADMLLTKADGISERYYSLSTQIEAERKRYYQILETQQRSSLDITPFLQWFLNCLERAITNSENILANILLKTKLWDYLNQSPVNERQKLVINRMLESTFKGFMNTSKYAKLAKCSTDTALRDIQDLKARGILAQNPGGGRSTSYRIAIERFE